MSVQSHKKQCHQLWIVKDDKHCHQKTRRITNPEAIREAECSALPLLNSGFQIHGYGLFCWIMGLHIYIQIILRVPTPVLPMTTPFPSPIFQISFPPNIKSAKRTYTLLSSFLKIQKRCIITVYYIKLWIKGYSLIA